MTCHLSQMSSYLLEQSDIVSLFFFLNLSSPLQPHSVDGLSFHPKSSDEVFAVDYRIVPQGKQWKTHCIGY